MFCLIKSCLSIYYRLAIAGLFCAYIPVNLARIQMRSLMLLFLMLSVPAAFVAAVPGAGGVNSDTVSSTIERSAVNAGAGLDAVSGPGESPGGGMIDLDEMGHVVTIGDDSDQYFIRVASAGSMRTIIVGGPCGRRLIAPALVSRLASSSILAYADTAGSS